MNGFSHSHYSVPGMFFHHHLPTCCSPAAFDHSQLQEAGAGKNTKNKLNPFRYNNSLVSADSFYANFTNTTFQKIPIPHLKCKYYETEISSLTRILLDLYELIPLNLVNTKLG